MRLTIGLRGCGHDAPRSGPPSLLVEMTIVVPRRSALLVIVYASMIVCTAIHATNILSTNGTPRGRSSFIGGALHHHQRVVVHDSRTMRAMCWRHRDTRGPPAQDVRRGYGGETVVLAVLTLRLQ